jgi:CHAT domain-containing protein
VIRFRFNRAFDPMRRRAHRGFPACLAVGLLLVGILARADDAPTPAFHEAQAFVDSGDFAASLPKWKEALAAYARDKNVPGQVQASIRLADAYRALGQDRLAMETLENVKALSAQGGDPRTDAIIQTSLGALLTLSTDTDDAEACLDKGVALAEKSGDPHVKAVALNNLANLRAFQGKDQEAAGEYRKAFALADQTRDDALAVKIATNAASACGKNSDWAGAEKWADTAIERSDRLPDNDAKAYARVSAGRTDQETFTQSGEKDDQLRRKAFAAYRRAAELAQKIDDPRVLSYALGYEAQLYEMEKKFPEALALTRQAVALAQQIKAPDILFRWEAQSGRLLAALRQPDAAIAAYQSAIVTLQPIRHDLSLHYGNANYHSSFREVAGPIFFSLADLLLQRAGHIPDGPDQQAALSSARDVIEDLKSAELEDYFQDDCANLLRSKITKIETLSPTAAIIYIIPLADRTEILVGLPSGKIARVTSPATAAQIEATATQFRFNLEKRTTNEYLDQASQLYDWLIRPLDGILQGTRIDTLVFVPDGALLTIPMSALNDGRQFLIQKYAVATTPGLTLLAPKPIGAQPTAMIIDALSDAVQGFAPLEHVPEEVKRIEAIYGAPEYLNRNFVKSAVDREFAADSYSIVHIASHGHFDSDSKKTFVLTYDSKLDLDELERMIRPSQIRDKPVELLTLSACQTAAGDDRAALGLAGIAVKSGARSALATLWFVDDEASTLMVGDFYQKLHDVPAISKAQALQAAQIQVLADPRYSHPCYWAPYLLIGNWL